MHIVQNHYGCIDADITYQPCVGGVDYPVDQVGDPIQIWIMGREFRVQVQYHIVRNITFVLLDAVSTISMILPQYYLVIFKVPFGLLILYCSRCSVNKPRRILILPEWMTWSPPSTMQRGILA